MADHLSPLHPEALAIIAELDNADLWEAHRERYRSLGHPTNDGGESGGDGNGDGDKPNDDKPNDDKGGDLGDAGKRALKAERDRAKAAEREAAELRARVQEFEDRDKTETQKLADSAQKATKRADDAEARAAKAEGELMRLRVAHELKVPAELVDRLRGDNEDDLKADAEALMKALGHEAGDEGATPPGSFDGGARSPSKTPTVDEQIAAAEKAGDWAKVDQLNAQKLAKIAGL